MTKTERDEYRRETVQRYRESGMTRKAFCEANGVALSTLDLWIRRFRNESPIESDSGSTLVAVGPAIERDGARRLRIKIGSDIVLELDLPVSERDIATILRAVRTV